MLGFKPRIKKYGTVIKKHFVEPFGEVSMSHWLHPSEGDKTIDPKDVEFLKSFLNSGDIAIDIGAHTGDSVLPIGLALGPTGKVLAFEPNPYVFNVLKENT